MRKHEPMPWGAFDSEGKLRARFESESEAYYYLRNRGHVHGGSYSRIEDPYLQLVQALRALTNGEGTANEILTKHTQAVRDAKRMLRELGEQS